MNLKYKGGKCGCSSSQLLSQNGGQNNNNSNNSGNNSGNSGNNGLMGMFKGFMGGQNIPPNGNGNGTMKESKPMKKSNAQMIMPVNAQMATPGNGTMKESKPMKKSNAQMNMPGNAQMGMSVNAQMGMSGSKKKSMKKSNSQINRTIKANNVIFSNGSSLETQIKDMQRNLNSITGRTKNNSNMEGGQNNNSLATLHNKLDVIANNVENIKEANNTPSLNLFGGRTQNGGQNNNSLATLHNKVDNIVNNVENIKNANNTPSLNLFGGGKLPMANSFLNNRTYGGGIFENIGNFIQGNTTKDKNEKIPTNSIIDTNTKPSSIMPSSTNVSSTNVSSTNVSSVKPSSTMSNSFPDPSTVINRPVLDSTISSASTDMGSDMGTSTGGNESSFINSLFGGYKPTKRNLKYLKRYKKNKSIGFTMRSSLKAKGLIKRANGTKRVSKKYK